VKTNGKLVRIGVQQRFFPALSRSPLGALDSALPEREDTDEERKLKEEQDARDHEAAMREALDHYDRTQDRAAAHDTYLRARDRRRRLRSAADSEGAYERRVREDYRNARDGDPDHRKDFASAASGGPDKPAADGRRGARDSRFAHDAAGRRGHVDVKAIFGSGAHRAQNH